MYPPASPGPPTSMVGKVEIRRQRKRLPHQARGCGPHSSACPPCQPAQLLRALRQGARLQTWKAGICPQGTTSSLQIKAGSGDSTEGRSFQPTLGLSSGPDWPVLPGESVSLDMLIPVLEDFLQVSLGAVSSVLVNSHVKCIFFLLAKRFFQDIVHFVTQRSLIKAHVSSFH